MATQSSNVGSNAWVDATNYEPGAELRRRAIDSLDAVNRKLLVAQAWKMRHGVPCRIQGSFSVGHSNLVRRNTFDDGVSWNR
jgi:hypothetical protein